MLFFWIPILIFLATLIFASYCLKKGDRYQWSLRYFASVMPVAYYFAGWKLVFLIEPYLNCKGHPKGLHDCIVYGIDLTALTDFGFWMMLLCVIFALPVSLWYLMNTMVRHWQANQSRKIQ